MTEVVEKVPVVLLKVHTDRGVEHPPGKTLYLRPDQAERLKGQGVCTDPPPAAPVATPEPAPAPATALPAPAEQPEPANQKSGTRSIKPMTKSEEGKHELQ